MRLITWLVLWLSFPLLLAAQTPDSAAIFRAARNAESEYESAARRLAPFAASSHVSGSCDEYVGRFCITYDTGRDTLPSEPAEVGRIRQTAIERLRAAFTVNPRRKATVFPLIRLLLEHKKPLEAVEVADRYRALASDVAAGEMLVALTRHAAADIPAAEAAISRWLTAVDTAEARRLADPSHLMTTRERSRYRRLSARERGDYDSLFWRYADALYMTPGNETRTEHFARQAESLLLKTVPFVRGAMGWGSDVHELMIRFGPVKARSRSWQRGSIASDDLAITEHWDPEQVMLAPPALDSALALRSRPLQGWPLDTVRSRSGHAPSTYRRILPLEHQAAIWRGTTGQLYMRIDGRVVVDSVAQDAGLREVAGALLFLDNKLKPLVTVTANLRIVADTVFFLAADRIPDGTAFYSAELFEGGSRLAARARFRAVPPATGERVYLADIQITEAFPPGELPESRDHPSMQPLPVLEIRDQQPFGVFAEVTLSKAPDSVQVRLEMTNIDGSPALIRAARWVGTRLGLTPTESAQRIAWNARIYEPVPTPIAVTLDPSGLKPGRYFIDLTVLTTDGQSAATRREIVLRGRDR